MTTDASRARRVLLVSRIADQREAYARSLRRTGFDVTMRDDCAGAEHAVIAQADMVVVDCEPGCEKDGIEVTRRVRQDERTKHLPVILLSNTAQAVEAERAEAAGADRVLRKPCPANALADEARRLLAARRRLAFDKQT